MSAIEVVRRSIIAASPDEVWRWHAQPGAFERLVPPWESVTVVERDPRGLVEGAQVQLEIRKGPITFDWLAEHRDVDPPHGFSDVQLRGPFASWYHRRRFEATADGGTALTDRITVELPMGPVGAIGNETIRDDLERMLTWRHEILEQDLTRTRREPLSPMRIAITGATGSIGTTLAPMLTTAGHQVVPISRQRLEGGIQWDPLDGVLNGAALEGVDAVIHLAGANLADGRWTDDRKALLRESRLVPTALLARTLAGLSAKPRVLISASAVGIYGDRGDEILDERSEPGEDFLAELGVAWERAADPARDAGIRVVHPRMGIVLTPSDGALAKMLTPFRLGAGGTLGSGRQWMSWIALDDVLGSYWRMLGDERLSGPVHVTAPDPIRNADFTKVLAGVLNRPAIIPVPEIALRAMFGEMADATVLASQRAVPRELERVGHHFEYPALEGALRHLLGRTANGEPRTASG